MGKAQHALKLPWFVFFQVLGGGGGFFSIFPLFSTCSFQVSNIFPRFPMCSPRVFPIAPHFNPICFAQSPLLLTYINGPKGEALNLSIEYYIMGSLHSFNFFFFCNGPIWTNWQKNRKWWLSPKSNTHPTPKRTLWVEPIFFHMFWPLTEVIKKIKEQGR